MVQLSRDINIKADDDSREVCVLNSKTFTPEVIGHVRSRDFRGQNVQKHEFVTVNPKTGREKVYTLGSTTSKFGFVNHSQVIQPLVDKGYTIKDQVMVRGGVQVITILTHPERESDIDLIKWDYNLWEGRERSSKRGIFEAVIVFSSIKPGQGERFHRGIFRWICTNGATAEIMDLGSLKMNHLNFNPTKILNNFVNVEPLTEAQIMGPYLGSKKGVTSLINVVDNIITYKKNKGANEENDEDDDGDGDDAKIDISGLASNWKIPLFLRNTIKSLYRLPLWYLVGFKRQLEAIIAQMDGDDIMGLDLLNAITSTINLARSSGKREVAVGRLFNRVNAVSDSCAKIIGSSSL